MNQSEHSDISQIKYLHLLVQEFDVRIDRGLVEAILSMSNTKQISSQYTVSTFKTLYIICFLARLVSSRHGNGSAKIARTHQDHKSCS
jgi:hypothetical protein